MHSDRSGATIFSGRGQQVVRRGWAPRAERVFAAVSSVTEVVVRAFVAALLVGVSPFVVIAQASVPEIRFDANITPLRLPAAMHFGEVVGIAMITRSPVRPSMSCGLPRF